MSSRQQQQAEDYNDNAFQYWLLFSLAIVLIPCTIWMYRKLVPKPIKKTIECSCAGCERKAKMKMDEQKKQTHNIFTYIKFALIGLMWLLFIYMMVNVVRQGIQEHEPYNPYSILGLNTGATDDEIKRAYRKLSLQYHPDKAPGKEAQDKFIQIAKAYEALTDPAIREKMEKYGNPDGPQPVSVGIALPSWLVDRSNSSFVLAAYLIALVILIPTGVYFWNKKSKKGGIEKIHQNSLSLYYHCIDDKTRLNHMIEIVGASQEFKDAIPERNSDEELLKAVTKAIPESYRMKKFRFNHPYIIKSTILLYAHISRIHQQIPQKLEEDLTYILENVKTLLSGAFYIQKDKRQMNSLVEILKLNQCITQAAWDDQSLKQIPYLDSFNISSLNFRKIFDIVKFNRVGPEVRREILQAQSFSEEKISDVENVLAKIPTEVGLNVKITSTAPDGVIYAASICFLEVEFIDKTPKKKKEEQSNNSNNNNNKSSTSTPAQPQLTEEQKQIEKELLSPVKKQKGMASKKGQKAKERDEKRQQKLQEIQKEKEKAEKKEQKQKEREEKAKRREEKNKNGEADDSDDDLDDDLSSSDESDAENHSDSGSDSESDSDWESATPKKSILAKPSQNIYHSPYMNEERPICWWFIFGDRLKNELVALAKSETWTPGHTMKFQFITPEKPGTYNYVLNLICDGYIGLDSQYPITLKTAFNPNPIQLPPQLQQQQQQQKAQNQPLTKKELKEQKKQKKLQ